VIADPSGLGSIRGLISLFQIVTRQIATGQKGLTSTSTRTIIIEAPSIVPTDDASTTAASSSAQ